MGINEDIADAFTKPFKPLIDFGKRAEEGLNKIPSFFKELERRFIDFGVGVKDIFDGLGVQIEGVGKGIELGFGDVGLLIEYCFILLGSYLACGVYFIGQLPKCFFYYVLEWIGQILYLPVRIFIWFMDTFCKIKLQKHMDKFWYFMEKIDKIIYKYAKFHIMHYPRSVRERCYVCKRLKQSVITRQTEVVNYDFAPNGGIAKVIDQYGEQMRRGAEEVKGVFRPWPK